MERREEVLKRGKIWRRASPTDLSFTHEAWPFFHLSRLTSLYHQRMDAYLKPIGMDVPRWRVLNILVEHETTPISIIADLAVIRIPTMTKLIYRMEAENLITTQVSSRDGRVTEVCLTDKGRSAVEQVRAKAELIFQRAFHDIEDAEIDQFMQTMKKVFKNIY
ncbi:MarR family winged helix-turn-helix transcriptional regulator [Acidomonas methanolica]|uniref:MarR family winged helix-turn-helix transcriptional regulator n=1 Tax=Acidomonas methanolica TaxID=437 RepID=UPI00211A73ED|nr:MarR family transcriptional regulator [Acidomonas methanolica]MCQ9156260.1 MarR family transcriptional regulator [Acidomonas methanolica]